VLQKVFIPWTPVIDALCYYLVANIIKWQPMDTHHIDPNLNQFFCFANLRVNFFVEFDECIDGEFANNKD
jgi:hypothetical protein